MITKEMLLEFALLKQKESMKEMKEIYDLIRPINPFERWYEWVALSALKKMRQEWDSAGNKAYFKEMKEEKNDNQAGR